MAHTKRAQIIEQIKLVSIIVKRMSIIPLHHFGLSFWKSFSNVTWCWIKSQLVLYTFKQTLQ